MKKMGLHEVRKEFLDFFEEKNHLVMESFPLVPRSDKTLLLINAGMAPLKPYFTGVSTPPKKRVATCQKCVRTGDIENVGKTSRHATFFEMLGNFSFGDYFKEEAIEWAWEFITEKLEIPKDIIWVSIYENDDEAFDIWNKKIGISEDRIVRLGKEDNFWELEVGPCGPCSEIYVDRGEKYGCGEEDCKPGCDCDRFIEIWNLVFSQYDKDEKGNYNILPNPNIDTGMGLERITAIMEGADNIFEIEIIKDLISEVEKRSGIKYGKDENKDVSIRVITDHIRAMTFLVADGILPSNEGRGYVLRRLIRRASRHGKLLGIEGEFLSHISMDVIEIWGDVYPELKEKKNEIQKIISIEERKFQETIDQGIDILNRYIKEMKETKQNILSGEKAFKLYDTYGFPLDLTKEILEEKDIGVDEKSFNLCMEKQKERARKARESDNGESWGLDSISNLINGCTTLFKGYETLETHSKIICIIKESLLQDKLKEGEKGILILNSTPFYAESGGQVGDTGIIKGTNFLAKVLDTQKAHNDAVLHYVEVFKGVINKYDEADCIVDFERRMNIARNHSATHLLHKALKEILGGHVNQAGSFVSPDRLRFDFTHFESINGDQLDKIERIVNEKILEGLDVRTIETSLNEAQKMGAIALFDEKYKENVRLVNMGDFSKELCGGTHVSNTNQIGLFKIVNESSVASGIRRIEAITGMSTYIYLKDMEKQINEISNKVKANKNDIPGKIDQLLIVLKEKDNEIENLKYKMANSAIGDILKNKEELDGIEIVTGKVDNLDMNNLRNLGDKIRDNISSGIVVLSSITDDGKVLFVAMATNDVLNKGIHAGNLLKEISRITGGGGGGRPDMAQAGGKNPNKVDFALNKVKDVVKEQLK